MCRKAVEDSNRTSEDKREKKKHIDHIRERERGRERDFSQLVFVLASHYSIE